KLEALAHAHPVCQRLLTIPGLGPLTATALMAAVSDAGGFKNGRQFAAWLGLVPKQYSTGGQTRLLGISQPGDSYAKYANCSSTGPGRRCAGRRRKLIGGANGYGGCWNGGGGIGRP